MRAATRGPLAGCKTRCRCSVSWSCSSPACSRAPAAASAKVPEGWLGVIADGPLTRQGAALDGEWDLMRDSGAQSVRTAFYWPNAQRQEGVAPDLSGFDATVLSAARRGLPVLPIVTGTPGWAGEKRDDETSPRAPGLYAGFLRALVARYGPAGSLWAEHPEIAARPIRAWQVWNEPNLTRYWSRQPFAKRYVKLLREADGALRTADPGARVDPRRAPERELDGAAQGLQGRRQALLRRRGAAPVHRQAAQRGPARRVREARDAPLPRRPHADLDHGAVLAGRQGQDEEHRRVRDDRQGPGEPPEARASASSPARASACASSASTGTRGSPRRTRRTRSTTPACAACATATIVSAPALAAFRAAARRLQR